MGHEPLVVATAAEALRAFVSRRPDALVLDIGLPDADGRDLCLALRAAGLDAPVLFLTARDGLHDKVAGFEAGGDDYLTKPFEIDELRVRLDALLRRTACPTPEEPGAPVLDPARHALVVGDVEVSLTPTEFRLLGRLMSEPATVVRRRTLDRRGLAARGHGQRQHPRLLRATTPEQARDAGPRGHRHGARGWLPVAVRSGSLRARMAASALLVSTLTAALLVIGVQLLLAASNDATAHSRLTSRAQAAAATVVSTPHGVRVLEQRSPVLDQNVWIFDENGTLIEGSLSQPALARTVRGVKASPEKRQVTLGDTSFYVLPVIRGGTQVATVVAAESLEPYEGAERHSLWLSMLLGATTVAVATVAAWVAATRSLRQVQAMADLADDWREHDTGARFDTGPGGDEIAHLGRTLDLMLDRIVEAITAERRLTDEIAHELRTPLSVVLAEADLARRTATGSTREALDAIYAAAVRMRDSIDTMLTVARAHARGSEGATVGELMSSLGLPPSSYDDVVLAAPASPLAASVRPLLDNAERHGAGSTRVEVSRDGRTVVIAVIDDGPGVAAGDLETVFQPGHTTRSDGSGLGLALARRMARTAGADLVARPGPGGRFEVRVPAR